MISNILLLLLKNTLIEYYIVTSLGRIKAIRMRQIALAHLLEFFDVLSYIIGNFVSTLKDLNFTFCRLHCTEIKVACFLN